MTKKSDCISDDYKVEIEQALEEVIQRPVGSDSLEAKVIDVVPDTVEQLLEYSRHSSQTEYVPEVKIYEDSEETSTNYLYDSDSLPEQVETDGSNTASYTFSVQETLTLQSAESKIADAILQNTFGVSDASFYMSPDDAARLEDFKRFHRTDWIFMYQAASWCVF